MMDSHPERKRHEIQARDSGYGLELLIDGEPVRYGQLPGGQYFLYEYAYDWTNDLTDLARKWIDHQTRAEEIRAMVKRSEREAG